MLGDLKMLNKLLQMKMLIQLKFRNKTLNCSATAMVNGFPALKKS